MSKSQWDVVHERMVEHPGGVFFEVRFRRRPWWRRLWYWIRRVDENTFEWHK